MRVYRLDFEGLPPIYRVAASMTQAIQDAHGIGIHKLVSCYLVPPPPADEPDPEYRAIRHLGHDVTQGYFNARDIAYGEDRGNSKDWQDWAREHGEDPAIKSYLANKPQDKAGVKNIPDAMLNRADSSGVIPFGCPVCNPRGKQEFASEGKCIAHGGPCKRGKPRNQNIDNYL